MGIFYQNDNCCSPQFDITESNVSQSSVWSFVVSHLVADRKLNFSLQIAHYKIDLPMKFGEKCDLSRLQLAIHVAGRKLDFFQSRLFTIKLSKVG